MKNWLFIALALVPGIATAHDAPTSFAGGSLELYAEALILAVEDKRFTALPADGSPWQLDDSQGGHFSVNVGPFHDAGTWTGLAAVSLPGAAAASPSGFDAGVYAKPDRLVDIGARRLHLRCQGIGSPTVVFESGVGSPGWDWAPVHAAVARRTRACLYDRAGLGFSEPANRPGTTANAADNLHALLRGAGEPAPYVFVGASYGAMIARFFAARHPGAVSALVLVDGHHEDEFERIDALSAGRYSRMMAGLQQECRACADASRHGFRPGSREHKACFAAPPLFADRSLAAAYLVQSLSPSYWDATLSEMENLHTVSSSQMRAARNGLAPVPVLALVRSVSPFDAPGKRPSALSASVEQANAEMQAETARLSHSGRTRVVEKAGHAIHIDNPQAVVAAVLESIEPGER